MIRIKIYCLENAEILNFMVRVNLFKIFEGVFGCESKIRF